VHKQDAYPSNVGVWLKLFATPCPLFKGNIVIADCMPLSSLLKTCLKLNTAKTKLLWTGLRCDISQLEGHGPAIQLGANTVSGCEYVRLLETPSLQGLLFTRSLIWYRQTERQSQ